jgi:hypothetical protein
LNDLEKENLSDVGAAALAMSFAACGVDSVIRKDGINAKTETL